MSAFWAGPPHYLGHSRLAPLPPRRIDRFVLAVTFNCESALFRLGDLNLKQPQPQAMSRDGAQPANSPEVNRWRNGGCGYVEIA